MKIAIEYVFPLAQNVIVNTEAGAKSHLFKEGRESEYLF